MMFQNNFIRQPHWLLRWGTTLVFFFFSFLMAIGAAFPFNEVLEGDVTVTSENPPVHIEVKKNGKLSVLNYKPGDSVIKGSVLGIMEDPVNVKDIQFLKKQLFLDLKDSISIEEFNADFPSNLNLGYTIQPYYSAFLNAGQDRILENFLKNDDLLQEQINVEINTHQALLESKENELFIAEKAFNLSYTEYQRYSQLFQKGVVSVQELEKVEKEFLDEQLEFQLLKQEIQKLKINKVFIKNQQLLSENKLYKNENFRKNELSRTGQDLINAITQWEQKHLLISPIDGKISFIEVWGKYQDLKEGETVFVIVPFEKPSFIGRCRIPVRNSGKIQKGQSAILKLDNFPYYEWGSLNATVTSFSQVPNTNSDAGFQVSFAIEDLITSYGKQLELDQEFNGTAEIILEKTNLLERTFYQFRHLWSNLGT